MQSRGVNSTQFNGDLKIAAKSFRLEAAAHNETKPWAVERDALITDDVNVMFAEIYECH